MAEEKLQNLQLYSISVLAVFLLYQQLSNHPQRNATKVYAALVCVLLLPDWKTAVSPSLYTTSYGV